MTDDLKARARLNISPPGLRDENEQIIADLLERLGRLERERERLREQMGADGLGPNEDDDLAEWYRVEQEEESAYRDALNREIEAAERKRDKLQSRIEELEQKIANLHENMGADEHEMKMWRESAQTAVRERDEARATLRCARTYVEKWCRDDT